MVFGTLKLPTETKIDYTFTVAQFFYLEGYFTLAGLTEHVKEGAILLYVKEDVPSKLSKDFCCNLSKGKSVFFTALLIQIKIVFYLTCY